MDLPLSGDLQADLRSANSAKREEATRQIFERYFQRLWKLVWANLHPRIRQRVDPEDIINRRIKSLILDFRDGLVRVDCKEKLWALLAQSVLSKARQAARRHTAGKRNVFREQQPTKELGYASTETIRVKKRLIQRLLHDFFDKNSGS